MFCCNQFDPSLSHNRSDDITTELREIGKRLKPDNFSIEEVVSALKKIRAIYTENSPFCPVVVGLRRSCLLLIHWLHAIPIMVSSDEHLVAQVGYLLSNHVAGIDPRLIQLLLVESLDVLRLLRDLLLMSSNGPQQIEVFPSFLAGARRSLSGPGSTQDDSKPARGIMLAIGGPENVSASIFVLCQVLSRLVCKHGDNLITAPVSVKLGMALLSLLSCPSEFKNRIDELMAVAESLDGHLVEANVEVWLQVAETMKQTPALWERHKGWFSSREFVDDEDVGASDDDETQMADIAVDSIKQEIIDALIGSKKVEIVSSPETILLSSNTMHLLSYAKEGPRCARVKISGSMSTDDLKCLLRYLGDSIDEGPICTSSDLVQSLTFVGGVSILAYLQTRSIGSAAVIAELSALYSTRLPGFLRFEKLFKWIPEFRSLTVPRIVGRLCWSRDGDALSVLATKEGSTVPELVVSYLQYPLLIQVLTQPLKENTKSQGDQTIASFVTGHILGNQYTLPQLMDASVSEVVVALLREVAKVHHPRSKEQYTQAVAVVRNALESVQALVSLASPVVQQAKRSKTASNESPKGAIHVLSENYLHTIQLIEEAPYCDNESKAIMLAILTEVVGERVVAPYAIRTVETILKLERNLSNGLRKKLWVNFSNAIRNSDKVLIPLLPLVVSGLRAAGDTGSVDQLLSLPGIDASMKSLLYLQADSNLLISVLESELRDDRILSARIRLIEICNSLIEQNHLKFSKPAPQVLKMLLNLVKHNMSNSALVSAVADFVGLTGPFLIDSVDSENTMATESGETGSVTISLSDAGKIKQFCVVLLTQFLIPNLRMDSHAFAIQEVLLAMGGNSFVSNFFNRESTLVLTPYLSSSYRASSSPIGEINSVICVEDLYLYLTSLVTNEKARHILESVRIAVMKDVGLCVFLIPYIIEVLSVDISDSAVDEVAKKVQSGFQALLGQNERKIEINCVFNCIDFCKNILFSKKKLASKETRFLTLLVEPPSQEDLDLMVTAAISVDDLSRALQYHEVKLEQLSKKQDDLVHKSCDLLKLAEIHDKLDSYAGVLGACSLADKKSFSTEIEEIKLEKTGKFTELLAMLDKAPSDDFQRRIRVLVDSGHYRAAIEAAKSHTEESLSDKVYEACWKLGQFDFSNMSSGSATPSFNTALCGLVSSENREELKSEFLKKMTNINSSQVARIYLISRLEKGDDFREQIPFMNPSCRDIILQAAHVVINGADMNFFEIELLRHHRKSGNISRVRNLIHFSRPAITNSMSEDLWRRHCEWGKACWAVGERSLAKDGLQQAMTVGGSGGPSSWPAELLVLKWSAEMELLIPKLVVANYRELMKRSLKRDARDKGAICFAFAEYLDTVGMNSVLTGTSGDIWNKQLLVREAAQNYFESIKFDTSGKRILFTLNRLFQLHWELSHSGDANQIKFSGEIVNVIQAGWKSVPEWVWYVALPQLMARIVGSTDFSPIIEEIVVSVTAQYPRQASWIVVPQLLNSKNQERREVGLRVLQKVIEKSSYPNIQSLVSVMRVVSDALVAVAKFEGTGSGLMRTLSESKEGARLLRDTSGLLVMPVKSQVSPSAVMSSGSPPFSNEVRIAKFQDPVHVYNTKAKPKRISVVDSGGKVYSFILKLEKKTDLRKDSRMMDFVNVVNQEIINRGGDSKLMTPLRTYSVLTLSEDSALIEFVPNLITMRKIIDESLSRMGKSVSLYLNKEVMNKLSNKNEGFAYFQSIVETVPPMIAEWFSREFIDPNKWLRVRTTFTKSQAMWSIVGHVVGLGDRHPDNILIDTNSGEVVHVDFDCIFSRGMILNIPELVPFRLTKICVSAMGVTGIEGTFRLSCEQIMALMRDKKRMLLAVLHAFIADPLIDWQGNGTSYRKARDVIGAIEKKLNGYVDVGEMRTSTPAIQDEKLILYNETSEKNSGLGKDRGAALSVEGQVDELIRAAVCPRNLAKMYLGWMPLF